MPASHARPILRRLQQIDGRAPVSIMTCNVKPDDPQLQTWLQEGVSLEVHTFDHPCPLLQGGLDKAKATYDKCVDLMFSIPNNTPEWQKGTFVIRPMARYELNDHVNFQLNLQNLSDERYATNPFQTHMTQIAPGRSALFTVNVRY